MDSTDPRNPPTDPLPITFFTNEQTGDTHPELLNTSPEPMVDWHERFANAAAAQAAAAQLALQLGNAYMAGDPAQTAEAEQKVLDQAARLSDDDDSRAARVVRAAAAVVHDARARAHARAAARVTSMAQRRLPQADLSAGVLAAINSTPGQGKRRNVSRFIWVHVTPGGVIARFVVAFAVVVVLATQTHLAAVSIAVITAAMLAISFLPVPIRNLGEPEATIEADETSPARETTPRKRPLGRSLAVIIPRGPTPAQAAAGRQFADGVREQIAETTRLLSVAYIWGTDRHKIDMLERQMLELVAALPSDYDSTEAVHLRTIEQLIIAKRASDR